MHTPGPWWVPGVEHPFSVLAGDPADPEIVVSADLNDPMAVMARNEDTSDEVSANTRLIAAAPDLLAACKLAMQWFEHPDIVSLSLPLRSVPVNAIHDAIAKAEGK